MRETLTILQAGKVETALLAEGGASLEGHRIGKQGGTGQGTSLDLLHTTLLRVRADGSRGVDVLGVLVDSEQTGSTTDGTSSTSALHGTSVSLVLGGTVNKVVTAEALSSAYACTRKRERLTSREYSRPAYCMPLLLQKSIHLPMVMSSDAVIAAASARPEVPSLIQMLAPEVNDCHPSGIGVLIVE